MYERVTPSFKIVFPTNILPTQLPNQIGARDRAATFSLPAPMMFTTLCDDCLVCASSLFGCRDAGSNDPHFQTTVVRQ